MKKQPEDLKIQKPLSLYPMKFDEVVDILLAPKPKKYEPKGERINREEDKSLSTT